MLCFKRHRDSAAGIGHDAASIPNHSGIARGRGIVRRRCAGVRTGRNRMKPRPRQAQRSKPISAPAPPFRKRPRPTGSRSPTSAGRATPSAAAAPDRARRLCAEPAAGLFGAAAAAGIRAAAPRSRQAAQCRSRPFRSSCRPRPSNAISCRTGRRPRPISSATYARVAAAAGLTREQAVRIYAFETGGNGGYDSQAGLTPGR